MRVIALHRLYQRTCKGCGYHWTVTRAQAQLVVRRSSIGRGAFGGGPGGVSGIPQDSSYIDNAIEASEATEKAQLELIEQFRTCAKCGSDVSSERPITKRHPADRPVV
jgi:hypothetical protein